MSETLINTLPLLQMLGDTSTQALRRGQLIQAGIDNDMIDAAADLGEVNITSGDHNKGGDHSLLAMVNLTDIGETKLDEAGC